MKYLIALFLLVSPGVQPPIFVHSFLYSLIRFLGRVVSCLGHGEV